MHAGGLYQYNPYVTIHLLAETHALGGNTLFTTDCNPGGDLFGGNCAVDGIATSCGIIQSIIGAGAAVQCPNNICSGIIDLTLNNAMVSAKKEEALIARWTTVVSLVICEYHRSRG